MKQLFKNQGPFSVDQFATKLTEREVMDLRETQPRRELIEFLTEQVNKKAEPQLA